MANKRMKEERARLEKEQKQEKEYTSKRKILRLFALGTLLMVVILLLMMMTEWAAIYNTDISDNEVEISGFNCASAALSNNYKAIDQEKYGDIAVFNYHAAAYVERISVVSLIVLFVLIVHGVIALFGLITNKQGAFNILSIIFAVAEAVLFIVCHAIGISMNDSGILTSYCNDNPACSVQSQAILPALFAILSLALPVIAMIRDHKITAEINADSAEDLKEPTGKRAEKKNRIGF